ncbi:MAG: IS200/IS605 family transposase [Mycobacterium sp.]
MPERRFRHTRGGVYSLGASGVVPEVPAPGLGGRVVGRLDERLDQIATEYGGQIVAHEVMPDHVHLLVQVGRADAPASVVRALEGRTGRVVRRELPYLRDHAKVLSSRSYFAASLGYVSETTVRRYLEQQWDTVLAS